MNEAPEQGAEQPDHLLALAAVTLVIINVLAIALLRRLNFDESLALRAGWLAVNQMPAQPDFLMPITGLLGLAAVTIQDPGTLVTCLRLVVVLSVLGSCAAMARAFGLSARAIVYASLLLMTSGSFLAHGIEFRYDWAIMLGLVAVATLLATDREGTPLALGVSLAWLASHHLKGLYFAGTLFLVVVWLWRGRQDRIAALRGLMTGAGILITLWVLMLLAIDGTAAAIGVYLDFLQLGASAQRVDWWTAVGPRVLADLPWWLVIAAGSAFALHARDPGATRALAFGGLALSFSVLHPHAWDYMLALPVPFFAVAAARGWDRLAGTGILNRGLLTAAAFALAASLLGATGAALRAPLSHQIQAMRLVRHFAEPKDRVVDPSGLLYFLAPVDPEWYSDTLFQARADRGDWMRETGHLVPGATWALNTYRLKLMPPEAVQALERDFELVCAGVLRNRTHERRQNVASPEQSAAAQACDPRLLSQGNFWGAQAVRSQVSAHE